jgi:Secretion system C-terminal sorting domain
MKKYKFLWAFLFLLPGLIVNGQAKKSLKNDPAAQIRQLVVIPSIKLPSIKMPSIKIPDPADLAIGIDVKKMMADAELMCPLLHFDPVLELKAERKSIEDVGLQWKAINNFKGLYFDVERSLDDTIHFEKVNYVLSENGGASEQYRLPDRNATETISYYRIKLQMSDGSFKYSNMAAVKGIMNNLFIIYPNPAASKAGISLLAAEDGLANFTFYNSEGKIVKQYQSLLTKGNNQKEYDITGLPAGTYLIKASLPGKKIMTGKLIKN